MYFSSWRERCRSIDLPVFVSRYQHESPTWDSAHRSTPAWRSGVLALLDRRLAEHMVSRQFVSARFGRIDRSIREVTSRFNASLHACHHRLVSGFRSQVLRRRRTDARKTMYFVRESQRHRSIQAGSNSRSSRERLDEFVELGG
jgi:hypothetical protein